MSCDPKELERILNIVSEKLPQPDAVEHHRNACPLCRYPMIGIECKELERLQIERLKEKE